MGNIVFSKEKKNNLEITEKKDQVQKRRCLSLVLPLNKFRINKK